MSVGTGTAIAIGLGAASVGTSAIGAKMASNSSKRAAEIQSDAARQAFEYERQQAGALQQRLQPFQQMGQAALPQLQALTNVQTARGAGGRPLAPVTPAPGAGLPTFIAGALPGGGIGGGDRMARPVGNGPTFASAATAAPAGGLGLPAPGGVQPGAGGGLVTLQAPDGTVKQVPAAQAELYLSRGATRVG